MMNAIGILLVAPGLLLQEGVEKVLQAHDFRIVSKAENIDSALASLTPNSAPDMVLIDLPDTNLPDRSSLNRLRTRLESGRICVLMPGSGVRTITPEFHSMVDGVLRRDMSPANLSLALKLIDSGEKVYTAPSKQMILYRDAHEKTETQTPPLPSNSLHKFTRREIQVLKELIRGETNKAISHALSCSEATVKVHVKSILRKLNVNSRSQAIVWAARNGMNLIEDAKQAN